MGTSRQILATDSVREGIKQIIIQEGLRPGDPMPTEMNLCDKLGVGRSSVREAMRQLEALDIVEVQRGRGTFVGAISLAPLVDSVTFRCTVDPRGAARVLREIVDVRRSLDAGQAAAVVAALAETEQPTLHQLADAMIEKAEAGVEFATEDRLFHTQLLGQTSGNELARSLIGAFWDIHTHALHQLEMPLPSELSDTAAAHRAMLLAALAGDEEGYRAAVDAHYDPLLRVLDRALLKEHEDAA